MGRVCLHILQNFFVNLASVTCVVKPYTKVLHVTVYSPILLCKSKTNNYTVFGRRATYFLISILHVLA